MSDIGKDQILLACSAKCSQQGGTFSLKIGDGAINASCARGGVVTSSYTEAVRDADDSKIEIAADTLGLLLNGDNSAVRAKAIIFSEELEINSDYDITFIASRDIIFKSGAQIHKKGAGNLYLKAGIESDFGKVIFEDNGTVIDVEGGGKVIINYSPESKTEGKYTHKYHNHKSYSQYVDPDNSVKSYMLVSDVRDLQDIDRFLHGNYALARDIDASKTSGWNNGKGFKPLMSIDTKMQNPIPFTGNFDGNGYKITGLFIDRPESNNVGLFGLIYNKNEGSRLMIENLSLENATFSGDHYVGSVAGEAVNVNFGHINIKDSNVTCRDVCGGLVGSASGVSIDDVTLGGATCTSEIAHYGLYAGAIRDSFFDMGHSDDGICPFWGYSTNISKV